MISIIADNILSPLGETTEANVQAVREGRTALKEHRLPGVPESFVASLFEPSIGFEEGLIRSIRGALASAKEKGVEIDMTSKEVIVIISSTKGNVADFECIGASAQHVASHFGNPNRPIVVSNACISGLSAQILAMRLLRTKAYRYAVVAGMDVQGKFIVSGFQSFKALSPEPCRPFDGDRCGLNLGEAAACMILTNEEHWTQGEWCLLEGAMRNDANHISNPSRVGEGCYRAIQQLGHPTDTWSCICAHGTATLFNDEMEACAIDRAGLSQVPTYSLKGYYGHTMGAAGILETIIALHAAQEGWIPATKGFAESSTTHEIHVTPKEEPCPKGDVLKLLSGFGGCNAAVGYRRLSENMEVSWPQEPKVSGIADLEMRYTLRLTPADMPDGMTAFYKEQVGNYPKFYKMDPLCKLGFLATELLLTEEKEAEGELTPEAETTRQDTRAVVLFSKHGSMADDRAYEETIRDAEAYFPSPTVFVYTLSNIVTGEIAIRHQYKSETACYILEEKDWTKMKEIIVTTFQDSGVKTVLGGWVDYNNDHDFDADLALFELITT